MPNTNTKQKKTKYKTTHSDKDEEPVHDHWGEEAELNETVLPRIALETMCEEGSDCRQKVSVYTDRYFVPHEKPEERGSYLCLQA